MPNTYLCQLGAWCSAQLSRITPKGARYRCLHSREDEGSAVPTSHSYSFLFISGHGNGYAELVVTCLAPALVQCLSEHKAFPWQLVSQELRA